jgi:hypothetical protein
MVILSKIKKSWNKVRKRKNIYLYARDIIDIEGKYINYIGLSLNRCDQHHIQHDVTIPFPLKDKSVEIDKLLSVINEIYRILTGVFRLSLTDYRTDILIDRSIKDSKGKIIFDSCGW